MSQNSPEIANNAAHVSREVELEFWGHSLLTREVGEARQLTLPGRLGRSGIFAGFLDRLEIRRELTVEDSMTRLEALNNNNTDVGGETPLTPQEEQ